MIDRIQTTLDGEPKRANGLDRKQVGLLASEESLSRQLQLRSEDSQEIGKLRYQLDGAIARKGRA